MTSIMKATVALLVLSISMIAGLESNGWNVSNAQVEHMTPVFLIFLPTFAITLILNFLRHYLIVPYCIYLQHCTVNKMMNFKVRGSYSHVGEN